MKILWFCSSPCNSVFRRQTVNNSIHGWLISLETELKKESTIELSVAYLSKVDEPPFSFDGVNYYPIVEKRPSSKIGKYFYDQRSDIKKDEARLPQMLEIVEKVNPDLIHIHGTETSFGLILPYLNAKYLVVISIQGMLSPYVEKYFSGLPKDIAFKFDSISDRFYGRGIRDTYQSFLFRAERERCYLTKCQYIFGRTFWDYDCTLAFNPARRYYVVNEIMRPPFYQSIWQGKEDSKKIRIISTVSGGIYKGYETVLKTADLLNKYSCIDYEWIIAGYDSKTKWVKIAEKLTGIKSQDVNIKLLGRQTAVQLVDLLINADMYVHVSHIENSPNTVCEAMLLGVPIIASFAGGTASLLENGKEGILYQDGDPYVLAGAITDVVQHPDKAKAYGEAARQRALERHNPQRIVGELIEGYTKIIEDFNNK